MDPDTLPRPPENTADERLREALVGLPAEGAETRLEALNRRALAQWEASVRPVPAGAGGDGRPWLTLWGKGGRASWLAAAGLAAGLVLMLHVWSRSPDPGLEELLQPDVLSQMAAGEM